MDVQDLASLTSEQQIEKFLNALFGPFDRFIYDPFVSDERIWIQIADGLEEPIAAILDSNRNKGRNAYFGVNCRYEGKTGADGTEYAVCYYADFDGILPDVALAAIEKAGLPPPTAVVMSGTGTHCYWKLIDSEYSSEEWEHRQEWIANALGSDDAVTDWQRISRLPGTLNNKEEYKHNPPRTQLVKCDAELRYSWKDLQPSCPEPFVEEPSEPRPKRERRNGELLPGDDFMDRASWSDALPKEWRSVGKFNRKGMQSWWHGLTGRLRKSATVRRGDKDHAPAIFVWSSTQTLLEPKKWHSMFHVYAVTHHGGIHEKAASQLSAEGYGKPSGLGFNAGEGGTLAAVSEEPKEQAVTLKHSPIIVGATDLRDTATMTDVGLGRRLVYESSGRLRYSTDRGIWHFYDGKRWIDDKKGTHAKRIGKQSAENIWRQMSDLGPEGTSNALVKYCRDVNSRRKVADAIEMALSEPLVEVHSSEFDSQPWLLNCENGVLDLRTQEMQAHAPEDLMTRLADVRFDKAADCPKWREFIDTITCGDKELAGFLQRSFGLALSADQSEQAVWVHHGNGSNGKGTLLSVLKEVLGDYAAPSSVEAFIHKRSEQDRTRSVAGIIGRRLVFAQETDDGCRLSEQAIKAFTGSDAINYRFLFEEVGTTYPTWHIHLAVNEKPQIRGGDYGIWRRVKLIPWNHQFVGDANRSRGDVEAELLEERSGILNWLLVGLWNWRENGLQEPECVRVATESYKQESDILTAWIADECIVDARAITGSTTLYESFRDWCKRTGNSPFNQTKFGREMNDRGYEKERPADGAYRHKVVRKGIGLAENHGQWAEFSS